MGLHFFETKKLVVPPSGGAAPPRGGTTNFSHPKSANHFSYEMKDAESDIFFDISSFP